MIFPETYKKDIDNAVSVLKYEDILTPNSVPMAINDKETNNAK
jgi:hypothetical protein